MTNEQLVEDFCRNEMTAYHVDNTKYRVRALTIDSTNYIGGFMFQVEFLAEATISIYFEGFYYTDEKRWELWKMIL